MTQTAIQIALLEPYDTVSHHAWWWAIDHSRHDVRVFSCPQLLDVADDMAER
jgi:hypothetical protein